MYIFSGCKISSLMADDFHLIDPSPCISFDTLAKPSVTVISYHLCIPHWETCFWWGDPFPVSFGSIWAFKGAAPVKGLSTFCNSLESAIFPKLRTKCKVSFFTHQRAKWHQNLWVIPTQPSNEWTLNKNFHLTVSPFT